MNQTPKTPTEEKAAGSLPSSTDVEKTSPSLGGAERREAIESLKKKAQARGIRRGPGRPVGSGRRQSEEGSDGDTERAGEPAPVSGSNGDRTNLDAARDLYASALDAVKGYREIGYAATGHNHWREIKPERMEAGAKTLVDVLAKLPQGAQIGILSSLVYLRLVSVGYDVFVDPVVKSYKLKNQPGQIKEEPTTENDTEKSA
jgi:hypothetical protein